MHIDKAIYYNALILQHVALQRTHWYRIILHRNTLQHTATFCNTLHHTAPQCITLQQTATRNNTPRHPVLAGEATASYARQKYLHFLPNLSSFWYWVAYGLKVLQMCVAMCVTMCVESAIPSNFSNPIHDLCSLPDCLISDHDFTYRLVQISKVCSGG